MVNSDPDLTLEFLGAEWLVASTAGLSKCAYRWLQRIGTITSNRSKLLHRSAKSEVIEGCSQPLCA